MIIYICPKKDLPSLFERVHPVLSTTWLARMVSDAPTRVFNKHEVCSYPGEFNVETKHAGIGTLLIRVHGLKDAFKIEASPVSDKDQRTLLAHYSPKIPGEYTIFVRWSGVHIPGSPFTVHISRRQGEYSLY